MMNDECFLNSSFEEIYSPGYQTEVYFAHPIINFLLRKVASQRRLFYFCESSLFHCFTASLLDRNFAKQNIFTKSN